MDEHYEFGRPVVLATLIPQTTTDQMNFFAYSDFDNSTRTHYTLAARPGNLNQVFAVSIAPNGTSGTLLSSANVNFPPSAGTNVTYLFAYEGVVYVSFSTGLLVSVNPATGAVLNSTQMFPASSGLYDTLACAFDRSTGTFYANAIGNGFFLHTINVVTGATTMVGPMPAAPGTGGSGGSRVDNAVASMVVYPNLADTSDVRLLELRFSNDAPFEFFAWLYPNGTSSQLPMPSDFYDQL
jgi:hypothetical protein